MACVRLLAFALTVVAFLPQGVQAGDLVEDMVWASLNDFDRARIIEGRDAFDGYASGNTDVALYSLNHLLHSLEALRPFAKTDSDRSGIDFDTGLTHVRLGFVYEVAGRMTEATDHYKVAVVLMHFNCAGGLELLKSKIAWLDRKYPNAPRPVTVTSDKCPGTGQFSETQTQAVLKVFRTAIELNKTFDEVVRSGQPIEILNKRRREIEQYDEGPLFAAMSTNATLLRAKGNAVLVAALVDVVLDRASSADESIPAALANAYAVQTSLVETEVRKRNKTQRKWLVKMLDFGIENDERLSGDARLRKQLEGFKKNLDHER